MEITSFVLGMLSIVAVAIVAVIVVGMLKINQLTNQISSLSLEMDIELSNLSRLIDTNTSSLWRQFEDTGRDITMVEKTLMSQIDQTRKETDQAIDQLHRIDAQLDENVRRYIDSRIDKVVSSGTIKEPKRQILNG